MADKFSLNGISNIFNESIARNEPTLAFELRNGKGLFLFMMLCTRARIIALNISDRRRRLQSFV